MSEQPTSGRIDFRRLAAYLASDCWSWAERWLPGGRAVGRDWVCGSVAGGEGRSFQLTCEGERAGAWIDRAGDGMGGNDLIGLRKAQLGGTMIAAARSIISEYRLPNSAWMEGSTAAPAPTQAPAARGAAAAEYEICMPVPADAPPYQARVAQGAGRATDGRPLARVWEYRDASGALLHLVARYDAPGAGKAIVPWVCARYPNGRTAWVPKHATAPRPLYGLNRLAANPALPVLVVEGEKATDAAQALLPGWVVVTWSGGGSAAEKADWAPLRGRQVAIWPDHDKPGHKAAALVSKNVPGATTVDVAAAAQALGWEIGPVTDSHGQDLADLPSEGAAQLAALMATPPTVETAAKKETGAWQSEYALLLADFVAHVEALPDGQRPDAMAGWLDRTGNPADIGDGEIVLAWKHALYLRGQEPEKEHIVTATTVQIREWRAERKRKILSPFVGHPATDAGRAALRTWVRAVTGGEDALHVAVIEHWIWQVRRRMAGLPIEHDIMPVLYGVQGSGKTTAVDMLCAVLCELSVPVTATQIIDPREAPLLARALIGRWDELAGSNKSESEMLKRAVTGATIAFRRLYSQDYEIRRRTITFIGTSNLPLNVIIRDTTGARRFAELPASKVDWDLLNGIDMAQVWRGTSESDPAPILPRLHALRAHQETLVHRDMVAAWLEWERSIGFKRIEYFRSDNPAKQIVPPLDGGIDADNPNAGPQPGGWRTDQVLERIKYYSHTVGQGKSGLVEQIDARLRQLGFESRRIRVGEGGRAARREYRWFLPVSKTISAPETEADLASDLEVQIAVAAAAGNFLAAHQLQQQLTAARAALRNRPATEAEGDIHVPF
jgi:hypothetical protein